MELSIFAETEWLANETIVRVSSRTREMPGVKDAAGVEAVAKWHEGVHIVSDAPTAQGQQQLLLDLASPKVICRRGEPYDEARLRPHRSSGRKKPAGPQLFPSFI